jgi:hypothetical protein
MENGEHGKNGIGKGENGESAKIELEYDRIRWDMG